MPEPKIPGKERYGGGRFSEKLPPTPPSKTVQCSLKAKAPRQRHQTGGRQWGKMSPQRLGGRNPCALPQGGFYAARGQGEAQNII